MSERPKILTAIVVPTGGWDIGIDISLAGQYDTSVVVTIPAGTYFMAGDNQADDFLFALQTAVQTGLTAAGANRYFVAWIDPTTHKVKLCFCGAGFIVGGGGAHLNDVRIDWTGTDTDVYEALGFDGDSDDVSTATDEPIFTADWQHAWGWYSDEDGQLEGLDIEDPNIITAMQSTSLSGRTKSQLVGDRYAATLRLQFLERSLNGRTKAHSRGIAYGDASVYPYERNQPLECWWMEARKGTRFRVYPNARIDTSLADLYSPTLAVDVGLRHTWAGPVLDVDPKRCVGGLVWLADIMSAATRTDIYQGFFIETNGAATVTLANTLAAGNFNGATPAYYFDHRYQTYVVDLEKMTKFQLTEFPALDRYNITIPMKRYIA